MSQALRRPGRRARGRRRAPKGPDHACRKRSRGNSLRSRRRSTRSVAWVLERSRLRAGLPGARRVRARAAAGRSACSRADSSRRLRRCSRASVSAISRSSPTRSTRGQTAGASSGGTTLSARSAASRASAASLPEDHESRLRRRRDLRSLRRARVGPGVCDPGPRAVPRRDRRAVRAFRHLLRRPRCALAPVS